MTRVRTDARTGHVPNRALILAVRARLARDERRARVRLSVRLWSRAVGLAALVGFGWVVMLFVLFSLLATLVRP